MQKKKNIQNHTKLNIEENENNVQLQIRQAPLPDPHELREYKNISKDLPDRIIKMAEKEQSFRHKATYIGQIQFLLLTLGGYSIAAFVGIYGQSWPTTGVAAAIAAGVSYVAYVFKSNNPKPPKNQQKTD